jgi:hypothetical protein
MRRFDSYTRMMAALSAWVLLHALSLGLSPWLARYVWAPWELGAVAFSALAWGHLRARGGHGVLALAALAAASVAAGLDSGGMAAPAMGARGAVLALLALAVWQAGGRGLALALAAAPFAAAVFLEGPWGLVALAVSALSALALAVALGRLQERDHPAGDRALQELRIGGAVRLDGAAGLRDLLRPLPFVELASDIRDVVYLNWMVPTERVAPLLPPPLRAHALGEHTAVSILTYGHGDFGPGFLGPLRRVLPSPLQSNWRLYLEPPDARPGATRDAIYFFKTTLSSAPHAIGSRFFSDGLPAHLAARFEHMREGDRVVTRLEPGGGSAPDLFAAVRETGARELPASFAACFPGGWDEAVRYLVEQNRAVSVLARAGVVIESRIDIPIRVEDVRPAVVEGAIESAFLAPYVAGCEPFAFVVPAVSFRALGERAIAPAAPASK